MQTRARDRWVLLATIVGSSLAFIDGSVVTLALPAIQRAFRASAGDVAWIVELYTLVLASLMLLGGALADRYGRKRIFTSGALLFALGSIACAFAWSIPTIFAARVLQGLGGMLVVPASLAILGDHFSGNARGRAIATWSAFSALTSTLGPMLGGVLIDSLGWRAVFWINVPLVAIVLYATFRHVAESRDERAPKVLDIGGALLATLGLGGVTYALILASSIGWKAIAVGVALAGGVLLLALFVRRERQIAAPLIPPGIFASRTFGTINLATLLLYASLSAIFYELPFVMIQAHGYSALQTALATLPMLVCLVLLARVGTAIAQRIGTRRVLTIGPSLVAGGYVLLALLAPERDYATAFFPGMLLVGLGMGITVAPLTTAVVESADPREVGVASGINNAVSRIAGLLAIAGLTILVSSLYNASLDRSLDALHAAPPLRAQANAQRDRLGGARFTDRALQHASNAAFEEGFRGVAFACAILAALTAAVNAIGINDTELRSA
jgi:EmrB/QacA subfamily drug resistance transporter